MSSSDKIFYFNENKCYGGPIFVEVPTYFYIHSSQCSIGRKPQD
ncbi:hypothetical protein pah_c268o007 [Parachlamydia acanthamoebae str. Hall's coccus]|nr:hypothetical protein pah_c268o007 [Parachlamydia acanthamoebae str. Hall's coccus]